jgi:LPXTG-motif cell wall-anchored protein
MNLFTRVGLGALGATGAIVLAVTPAGATAYAATRDCDGRVALTTGDVGADTTGVFHAGDRTWEVGPGETTTVTFDSISGGTVHVQVVFTMADGSTWDEEQDVAIVDEQCESSPSPAPETIAPPVTSTPPSVVPPSDPGPVDPPATEAPEPTLPSTGVSTGVVASTGAALLAAGAGLVMLARRRAA